VVFEIMKCIENSLLIYLLKDGVEFHGCSDKYKMLDNLKRKRVPNVGRGR